MHGQAHRGDIAYTYIVLFVDICTVLVKILNDIQVALITGRNESCLSILNVIQNEVRGCVVLSYLFV